MPAAPPSGLPTLTPDPAAPAPPLTLENRPSPPPDAPKPFYRKAWFWGAVGVVVVTAAIILIASQSEGGPPDTHLGNMHAF